MSLNIKYLNIKISIIILMFAGNLFAQQPIKLSTPSDSLQYSLGAFVGQWMINSGFTISDKTLFNRGMDDILNGMPRAINDSLINNIIATYQLSIQNQKNLQQEAQMFAALKEQPGVGILPNGVHYIVVKTGKGVRPMEKDSIVMNAVGVFPDGSLFENTFEKQKAIRNMPSKLIPGLKEAIQLMPEGSVWKIFVPSALAYGTVGIPDIIPPNSALVFEITLEEVIRANR